jgi:hypothetical protein
MKRMMSMVAGLVLVTGLGVAAPAQADERVCRGTIGRVTLDNVKVPAGANCTLNGTRVKGNIKVNGNARLSAGNVRVDGNIQSQGHTRVSVVDSFVDGSIQLESGGAVNLRRNDVNGDIQLFSNRKAGTKYVFRNIVDGNLQCKSNVPAPTGGQNRVAGNKEDQCRRL